jgi:hypothetical protein
VTQTPGPAYACEVWSWEQHLRGGGGTPWRGWLREGPHSATPPAGWLPPGAAQLELARRAAVSYDDAGAFADLVLTRSGPGRGRAQQPLLWPHAPQPRFGAPAIDPADVPVEELVRLTVGVLTDLMLRQPATRTDRVPAAPRRGLLTRAPAFRLAGAPVTTSVVRRRLAASGHVEGGRRPEVVVLAEPFDEALAQAWSARVQRGAAVRWHGFVERWSGREHLPPSVDLVATAQHWAAAVGPDRVRLVVAGRAVRDHGAGAAAATAGLLGVDLAPYDPGGAAGDGLLDLAPEQVDAVRRVSGLLAVRAGDEERDAALARLRALLAPASRAAGLTVPRAYRDWAGASAAQQVTDLAAGGYAVLGGLEDLVPRFDEDRPEHPRKDRVLDVLLAACVAATTRRRPSEGGRTR